MRLKRMLWHCTKLRLLPKILKEGLIPQIPTLRANKVRAIYFSKNMFGWMYHATLSGDVAGLALKINVAGLNLQKDYHDKNDVISLSGKVDLDEDYLCKEGIPPNRIIEFWEEYETNSFRKIKDEDLDGTK